MKNPKKIFLLLIHIGFLNSCFAQKVSVVNAKIISWSSVTKNRITKEKIKSAAFNYSKKKINSDSLTYYFARLVPTTDTLYNIRMYCLVNKHPFVKEIFIDKNGTVQVNNKNYSKNSSFANYLINNVVTDRKEEFFPDWLKK